MTRSHLALFVTLVSLGIPAAAQQTDTLEKRGSSADCICPQEGRWKVRNLEGWMRCMGMKRKVKGKDTNFGTTWILDEDCSKLFGEAAEKKRESAVMRRVEGCGFEGTAKGEEAGMEMVFEISWTIEEDDFITGEMYLNPEDEGSVCEGYRPFEMTFERPVPEKEYPKRKRKMEEKLEKFLRENDQTL